MMMIARIGGMGLHVVIEVAQVVAILLDVRGMTTTMMIVGGTTALPVIEIVDETVMTTKIIAGTVTETVGREMTDIAAQDILLNPPVMTGTEIETATLAEADETISFGCLNCKALVYDEIGHPLPGNTPLY